MRYFQVVTNRDAPRLIADLFDDPAVEVESMNPAGPVCKEIVVHAEPGYMQKGWRVYDVPR